MYKVYNEDNELHYMPEEAQFKRMYSSGSERTKMNGKLFVLKQCVYPYMTVKPIVVEFLNRPVAKRMDIARQWLPEKDGAVDISGAFSRKATAGT